MIEIRVEGRTERGAVKWVCVPEEICLGAAGSSGMEKIRVSLPAAWDGMTVRMTFLPYRRPAVAVLVRDGDEVEVTGNMTCGRGGTGEIVFDAATDGKATYTAAGARYTVYSHAAAGGEDPGYTPDEWQQFVARVEDAARSTEEALNEAKGLDISKDIQAAVEAAAELHVKLDEADGLAEAAADAADRAEAAAEVAENAAAGSMPDGSITTEKLAPDAEAPFAGNGVHQLAHEKVGTMHQLSGLGGRTGMVSVVFKASAAFAEGDIFVIDGVTYAARMPDGEAVADGAFTAGAAVGAVLDTAGKTVNFKAGGGSKKRLITEIITADQDWTVPEGVKSINVRLFGGGGAGGTSYLDSSYYEEDDAWRSITSGGGGGHMAYNSFNVVPGTVYHITIGQGGAPAGESFRGLPGGSGGTTSFGSLLSASGGSGGGLNGGDGGSGGGGGQGALGAYGNGGNASYGGGGGGAYKGNGGRGGTYGGGGGSGGNGGSGGAKGTHGGKGGNKATAGSAGTNTIGQGLDFEGTGAAGASGTRRGGGGGGGYGGPGGAGGYGMRDSYGDSYYGDGGGGGGYGAKGGSGGSTIAVSDDDDTGRCEGGGGGGGYGGPGGSGDYGYGGGGGGYGLGGAGGSFSGSKNGGIAAGGRGGSYFDTSLLATVYDRLPGYGGNGICIITYYG